VLTTPSIPFPRIKKASSPVLKGGSLSKGRGRLTIYIANSRERRGEKRRFGVFLIPIINTAVQWEKLQILKTDITLEKSTTSRFFSFPAFKLASIIPQLSKPMQHIFENIFLGPPTAGITALVWRI
jgi:hypothetical protein